MLPARSAAPIVGTLLTSDGVVPGCKFDIEGSGGNYTVTGLCPNPVGGKGTILSKATVVFEGDTVMHSVSDSVSDIPSMQMTIHNVSDSRWLGPCPAGTVPGEHGTLKNGVFQKQSP